MPSVDVERILSSMNPDCIFGGYEAYNPDAVDDHGDLRKSFTNMASYIPRCVGMRYETITDDGVTCVIEWQHIVSRAGQEERSRIALAGISAYERGENGLLSGIRISDYAGYERTIDWSKTPVSEEEAKSINYVEAFPAGCGRNPQS